MQTTFDTLDTYSGFSLLQNYFYLKLEMFILPNESLELTLLFFSSDTFFAAVHAHIISYISNRSHTSRLRNCRTLHKKCLNQQDRSYFTAVRIIKRQQKIPGGPSTNFLPLILKRKKDLELCSPRSELTYPYLIGLSLLLTLNIQGGVSKLIAQPWLDLAYGISI